MNKYLWCALRWQARVVASVELARQMGRTNVPYDWGLRDTEDRVSNALWHYLHPYKA